MIRSSPLPASNGGVHSSSSSPRHPEPAPENIRSSTTPGYPLAGVCVEEESYALSTFGGVTFQENSSTCSALLTILIHVTNEEFMNVQLILIGQGVTGIRVS